MLIRRLRRWRRFFGASALAPVTTRRASLCGGFGLAAFAADGGEILADSHRLPGQFFLDQYAEIVGQAARFQGFPEQARARHGRDLHDPTAIVSSVTGPYFLTPVTCGPLYVGTGFAEFRQLSESKRAPQGDPWIIGCQRGERTAHGGVFYDSFDSVFSFVSFFHLILLIAISSISKPVGFVKGNRQVFLGGEG